MQTSSLCLRTAGLKANHHHHYPLALQKSSVTILNRHQGRWLNFSAAGHSRSSLISPRIQIWARAQAHLETTTPPAGDGQHIDKMEDAESISSSEVKNDMVRLSAAAAAVFLACTFGLMCASPIARAFWPFPTQTVTDEKTTETVAVLKNKSDAEITIEALSQIFELKKTQLTLPELWYEILERSRPPHLPKDYPQLSKKDLDIERGIETKELQRIFMEFMQKNWYGDAYVMGLVLIDIYIKQCKYEDANKICKVLEDKIFKDIQGSALAQDGKFKIRKDVLDMINNSKKNEVRNFLKKVADNPNAYFP